MARWYAQGLSALVDKVVTNVAEEPSEIPRDPLLTVYPQPATSDVTFSVQGLQTAVPLQATIRSSAGELVSTVPLQHGCTTFSHEQLGLVTGWYLVSVSAGGVTAHQPLVVVRP
jgi:hypothetical protein